jgi:hypothetical protein
MCQIFIKGCKSNGLQMVLIKGFLFILTSNCMMISSFENIEENLLIKVIERWLPLFLRMFKGMGLFQGTIY